ncbi:FAD binding domain-containing protein [Niallia oryzisoli]|uniref:FAD binding domain-containing protein n=1 Tax=Niallia oryzisoli TaxID=1737571 RepID=A0ABZ2CR52_9BACI
MRILETKVWSPKDIGEAWDIKTSLQDQAVFISGGTFLQTKWEKGVPYPPHLINLGDIREYHQIDSRLEKDSFTIHIGAFAKLAECKNHPLIKETFSLLSDMIGTIAAPAVRNIGTIGGNIANRTGDTIPALLALDAEVSYFNGNEIKRERLESWLQKNEDSLILEIILTEPKTSFRNYQFSKKVGRREAFSASVVTIAGVCSIDKNRVEFIHLAAGGGDSVPKRLKRSERLLNNQLVDTIKPQQIYEELLKEYELVSDAFFSADYRRKVAANLFMAEWENWREENGETYVK